MVFWRVQGTSGAAFFLWMCLCAAIACKWKREPFSPGAWYHTAPPRFRTRRCKSVSPDLTGSPPLVNWGRRSWIGDSLFSQ